MSWNLFFMNLGVAYAATWVFKIVDLIVHNERIEEALIERIVPAIRQMDHELDGMLRIIVAHGL